MSQIVAVFIFFMAFQLIFAGDAKAYLDPGSGSYLIQILVATLAGAGLLVRSQWDKIKSIFSGKKDKPRKDNHDR